MTAEPKTNRRGRADNIVSFEMVCRPEDDVFPEGQLQDMLDELARVVARAAARRDARGGQHGQPA
ncbi:hypothetical protein [Magnetospirillum sp. 64-120]|uniref:hypothetical protein n=1 Tax=Magnetospirillum sp. 64-120 TaxID=1895778 RepID=UPI0025C52665|nr:hypothetical protein [Magnetospirillum sp. 64-120]